MNFGNEENKLFALPATERMRFAEIGPMPLANDNAIKKNCSSFSIIRFNVFIKLQKKIGKCSKTMKLRRLFELFILLLFCRDLCNAARLVLRVLLLRSFHYL